MALRKNVVIYLNNLLTTDHTPKDSVVHVDNPIWPNSKSGHKFHRFQQVRDKIPVQMFPFVSAIEQSMPQILPHSTRRLEWTISHQCTSSGWGHSSRFGDEPKTHPPLPKVFGFFSLFSAPKFFLPTYLPPTYLPPPTYLTSFCAHSIVEAHESSKQEGRRGRVELGAKSRRAEVATRNGREKMVARSRRAEVVARTTCLKREPKVRGQNGSLKVSSSLFFIIFCCFLAWCCCKMLSLSSLCLKRRRW